MPKLARVGLLRGDAISPQLKELRPAAVALKLKLEEIETQPDLKDLESAFQTCKTEASRRDYDDYRSPFFAGRKRIVELAGKHRLPAIYFR